MNADEDNTAGRFLKSRTTDGLDALQLSELCRGAVFITCNEEGRNPTTLVASVDLHNNVLNMKADSGGELKHHLDISVKCIKLVLRGNRPKDVSRIKTSLREEPSDAQWLCLFLGARWPWRAMYLIAPNVDIADVWCAGLTRLVRQQPYPKGYSPGTPIDDWLHRTYVTLKQQDRGAVHAVVAVGHFAKRRLWSAFKVLKQLTATNEFLKEAVTKEMHDLSYPTFQLLYYVHAAHERTDIHRIFASACGSAARANCHVMPAFPATRAGRRRSSIQAIAGFLTSRQVKTSVEPSPPATSEGGANNALVMSASDLMAFLKTSQGTDAVSMEDAVRIITEYERPAANGTDPAQGTADSLSLVGFTRYMISQDIAATPPRGGVIEHDMTLPLSEYLIASSHNTYLTGHQLHGESSVLMYTLILHTGCRCVELDCWDGEEGDPVIYHGYTLTTKIRFEAVICTIAAHAFAVSPYPLILSLENHCSLGQQAKMVAIMKEAFGDRLLSRRISNDDDTHLPSPEELKYKILIKDRCTLSSKDKRTVSNTIKNSYGICTGTTPWVLADTESTFGLPYGHTPSSGLYDAGCTEASVLVPSPLSSPVHAHSFGDLSSATLIPSPTSPVLVPPKSTSSSSSSLLNYFPSPSSSPSSPSSSGSSLAVLSPSISLHLSSPLSLPSSPPSPPLPPPLPLPLSQCASLPGSPLLNTIFEEDLWSLNKTCSDQAASGDGSCHIDSTKTKHFATQKLIKRKTMDREENLLSSAHGHHRLAPSPLRDSVEATKHPHKCATGGEHNGANSVEFGMGTSGHGDVCHLAKGDGVTANTPERSRRAGSLPSLYPGRSQSSPIILTSSPQHTTQHCPLTDSSHIRSSSDPTIIARKATPTQDEGRLGHSMLDECWSGDSILLQVFTNEEGGGTPPLDTAEDFFLNNDTLPELADLVIYTKPIRLPPQGFKHGTNMRCTEMYSLSEPVLRKAARRTPRELSLFNTNHLTRVYPGSARISSSNFDPTYFWMLGCQMVAMNYQTNDLFLQHYLSIFGQNGGCGYVRKPQGLCELFEHFRTTGDVPTMELIITVISAQLPHMHCHLPTVAMEVVGISCDSYKLKSQASHVAGSSCAIWPGGRATLCARVPFKELASIKFTLNVEKNEDQQYSTVVPLVSLTPGYRHIYFDLVVLHSSPPPSLFVRIAVKDHPSLLHATPPSLLHATPPSLLHAMPPKNTTTVDNGDSTTADCLGISAIQLTEKVVEAAGSRTDRNVQRLVHTAGSEEFSLSPNDSAQPSVGPTLLAVAVHFRLPHVHSEPLTLFADKLTVAEELLAGAVHRLGSKVKMTCPHLKDTNEDDYKQYFDLLLADGNLNVLTSLDMQERILKHFSQPSSSRCLIVALKGKGDTKPLCSGMEGSGSTPGLCCKIEGCGSAPEQCGKMEDSDRYPSSMNAEEDGEEEAEPLSTSFIVHPLSAISLTTDIGSTRNGKVTCPSTAALGANQQQVPPMTSIKVCRVSSEAARRYLEEYYQRLDGKCTQLPEKQERCLKKCYYANADNKRRRVSVDVGLLVAHGHKTHTQGTLNHNQEQTRDDQDHVRHSPTKQAISLPKKWLLARRPSLKRVVPETESVDKLNGSDSCLSPQQDTSSTQNRWASKRTWSLKKKPSNEKNVGIRRSETATFHCHSPPLPPSDVL